MRKYELIQLALNANNQERRRSVSRSETRVTADLAAVQTMQRVNTDPALKMTVTDQAIWRD